MRKRTILLSLTLVLLMPVVAGAQMMGSGSHHGSSPVTRPSNGMHGGNGNMHGGGNGPTNGCLMGGDHSMGNGFAVASDGTLLLVMAGEPVARPQFRAVRGGTVRWTKELPGALAKMLISGELVVTITQSAMDGQTSPKTTVTAYAVATGAMIWTIDLDGAGRDAALFDGGVYIVLGTGDGGEAGHCGGDMDEGMDDESMMKSNVAAISNEGKMLWTLALEP
jgi:outer membrane protein assembly factor BamB